MRGKWDRELRICSMQGPMGGVQGGSSLRAGRIYAIARPERIAKGERVQDMGCVADNAEKRLRRVASATEVQVTEGAIPKRYAGVWGTLGLCGEQYLRIFPYLSHVFSQVL